MCHLSCVLCSGAYGTTSTIHREYSTSLMLCMVLRVLRSTTYTLHTPLRVCYSVPLVLHVIHAAPSCTHSPCHASYILCPCVLCYYTLVLYGTLCRPLQVPLSLLTCLSLSLCAPLLTVAVHCLLSIGWEGVWGGAKYGIHPVYLRARARVLGYCGLLRA